MKNKIQKNVCLVNDSENDLCTTAGKTINTVFLAEKDYPQNKKINFVIFYNDLCIPLNSNLPAYYPKNYLLNPLHLRRLLSIL